MPPLFVLFFKALLIGLSIAAPVGPVGLLCIQRSLAHGARIGFASGLGAAVADACYGALGAFGVGVVLEFFVALQRPLALAGAVFLLWMAWGLWRTRPADQQAAGQPAVPARLLAGRAFASVLGLTLTNPMTVLSFTAVFAALGAGAGPTQTDQAVVMVAGVFTGSALWWLGLALLVATWRQRIGPVFLRRVNQAAALLLLAMALWQLGVVWRGL